MQSKAAHIVPPVQRAKCQIMDLAIVSGVTLVSTRRVSLQVHVTLVSPAKFPLRAARSAASV